MRPARLRRAFAAAFAVLPVLAACSRSTSLPAPAPIESTTLLTRLGADTIAVEQYTRTATRVEGVLVLRVPVTAVGRYSVDLDAAGAPVRASYSVRRGDGVEIPNNPQSLSVRYSADSVFLVGHRSAGDTARAAAVRGELVPYVNGSYGLYELALSRLRASNRDSAEFALVPLNFGMRSTSPLAVRRIGADSLRINYFGNPLYARHDAAGRLLFLDGSQTTGKVRVDRVATLDVQALAREWTLREQSSAPIGQTSTRDTVRATIGAATLWIDYGRPALRGRDVWANGVLGDTLWRTGANAATQLRTDVEINIGGTTVPPGTYTLWTAIAGGRYSLVINRQFGQWGTVYDARRDLARVPLTVSTAAAPAERFTIAVTPQGTRAGLLVLSWGTRQLTVPITAR